MKKQANQTKRNQDLGYNPERDERKTKAVRKAWAHRVSVQAKRQEAAKVRHATVKRSEANAVRRAKLAVMKAQKVLDAAMEAMEVTRLAGEAANNAQGIK